MLRKAAPFAEDFGLTPNAEGLIVRRRWQLHPGAVEDWHLDAFVLLAMNQSLRKAHDIFPGRCQGQPYDGEAAGQGQRYFHAGRNAVEYGGGNVDPDHARTRVRQIEQRPTGANVLA